MWQFVALRGLSSRGEGLTHVGKLINICSAIAGGRDNAKPFRHVALQSPWEQECWKQPAASVSRRTLGKSITHWVSVSSSVKWALWGLSHSFFQQVFIESLLYVRHRSGYGNTAMIKIWKKNLCPFEVPESPQHTTPGGHHINILSKSSLKQNSECIVNGASWKDALGEVDEK